MKTTPTLVLLTALAALALLSGPAAAEVNNRVYGDGIDLEEATPIADILADPDAWIGKTVRVDGGVLDVCSRRGCWIQVGDEESSIQIKVEDGVIVFPAEAKGRVAAAQGEVEAIEMTREKYLDWLAHEAEEKGEEFDPETAEIGDGPYRIIRIKGTGAIIEAGP